jgi:hypothetical protein
MIVNQTAYVNGMVEYVHKIHAQIQQLLRQIVFKHHNVIGVIVN